VRAFFTVLLFFFVAPVFAETVDGRWHAGIGDPTVWGWVTVAFYLLASLLSFRQYRRLKPVGESAQFWLYLALALFLLAINKQLDLQSLFTEILRDHALAHGWYEKRAAYQSAFIIFLGVTSLLALIVLRVFLANAWRHYWLAWVGVLLLSTFVLMRAASFHHVDFLINMQFSGLRLNVMMEIGALLLIIVAALKRPYKRLGKPNNVVTVEAGSFVEIETDEASVACPKCGFAALSSAVHGRTFKCKRCRHKYTLFIANY